VDNDNTAESRFDALESKLAYQDETVRQLDEALVRQQQQISDLEALVRALKERVLAIGESAAGAVDVDEPPPHY